jgi:phage tail-like protein
VSPRTAQGALTGSRPFLTSNFRVDFGDGKARNASGGFAEVIFPEFRLEPVPGVTENKLILKRGVCGALELYTWWEQTRLGLAPPRPKVAVQLLRQDLRTVALTWTFHQVRPVALSYSPLRALEDAVLIETLELAFERFDLS